MMGYVGNIEKLSLENEFFRQVLFTTSKSQLVVMALAPGEDIGEETHLDHDQFLRIESGEGKAILDGREYSITDGSAVVVPAGIRHNVVNTSGKVMHLYSIYTPPEHPKGTVHKTKP